MHGLEQQVNINSECVFLTKVGLTGFPIIDSIRSNDINYFDHEVQANIHFLRWEKPFAHPCVGIWGHILSVILNTPSKLMLIIMTTG